MSQLSLAMILMRHMNPSTMAQSAAQQTGGADASQDASMIMAAAPQLIQDTVQLSPQASSAAQSSSGSTQATQPSGSSAQPNGANSPAGIQGQNTGLDGASSQRSGQAQPSSSQIIADLAMLTVPGGGSSSKPPDPAALASMSVPTGQTLDVMA
jgi:hypothetical protein